MARIRTIKPEFFTDEDIARLDPVIRVAFIGLWCHADKAGRLEDRPARLKVVVLPYDDVDFGAVLDALVAGRFVRRYAGPDGRAYLQVRSFEKHQRPRQDEVESQLPEPPELTELDTAPHLFSDEPVSAQRLGKERNGSGKEGSARVAQARPAARDVVDLWNQSVTAPIPQVTKLTADRSAKINARLKECPDLATWRTVFLWINRQDWCRAPGTGDHPNWTATLDWLCKSAGQFQRKVEQATSNDRRKQKRRPANCDCVEPCDNEHDHTKKYLDREESFE